MKCIRSASKMQPNKLEFFPKHNRFNHSKSTKSHSQRKPIKHFPKQVNDISNRIQLGPQKLSSEQNGLRGPHRSEKKFLETKKCTEKWFCPRQRRRLQTKKSAMYRRRRHRRGRGRRDGLRHRTFGRTKIYLKLFRDWWNYDRRVVDLAKHDFLFWVVQHSG